MRSVFRLLSLAAVAFVVCSCGGGSAGSEIVQQPERSGDSPPPVLQPEPEPEPDGNAVALFSDVTSASGISFKTGNKGGMSNNEVPVIVPNGVAAGDYDNDGDVDLFIVRGDIGANLLYVNQGNMVFEDKASEAGIAFTKSANENYRHSSPAFADLDGDGDLDLFLAGLDGDPSVIYSNSGDGTFVNVSSGSGIDNMAAEYSMSTAFGDYDMDGDLDLALGHWGTPRNFVDGPGDTEHLWRNDSDTSGIRFTSVSLQTGISPSIITNPDPYVSQRSFDHTFTPTFARINEDMYPDLLMVGDFNFSQVFINNQDGTFTNATDFQVIIDGNGMGSAVGDYDGDGDLDWFVSSILATGEAVPPQLSRIGNRLYRNDDGGFTDVTDESMVADGGWGWGSCFADIDNDGALDIYQTNGWPEHEEFGGFPVDTTRLFMSNGNGTFTERSAEKGLNDTQQGRGVVCADFDTDGDIDILQMHLDDTVSATLWENTLNTNNYLVIALRGASPNTDAIGARIIVNVAGKDQLREVNLGSNFASHNPSQQHFGLGSISQADTVTVEWPDGEETFLQAVAANQHLVIEHPGFNGLRLQVTQGSGSGIYDAGDPVNIEAPAPLDERYHFSHWTSDGGGSFSDAESENTVFTMPDEPVSIMAHYLPGPKDETLSAARLWNEVLLQAIRNDYARPTVHARNLFHISSAMYDAWSAYDEVAKPWLLGRERSGENCVFSKENINEPEINIEEIISFAAFRLIEHRFKNSPGSAQTALDANSLMSALGYDSMIDSKDYFDGSASALGNHIADCYIRFGFADNSNEVNDYANQFYSPINAPLKPDLPGNPDITHLSRWQPLSLQQFIDQSGNPVSEAPEFLSPEWGIVYPFALDNENLTIYERDGFEYRVFYDPGAPPTTQYLSETYKSAFSMVSIWSSHLDASDGVEIDISPASLGNIENYPDSFEGYSDFYDTFNGGDASVGYEVNPANGLTYEHQFVPRGDYARVLAEFWADGPDSETPPGHWFVILNEVSDHELMPKQFEGVGAPLTELEWDVKAYFALGGAMHDAAIAAWGIKGWYDYIRPISSIRAMADLGQSSNVNLSSYHPDGIVLYEGFIELVEEGDVLAGLENEHVGKIKLRAWRGPNLISDPEIDIAGVGWILAEDWWPYQRPSFVTPPFAGYISGHSTYSRAAAEVMTALTGDPFFPGGMSQFKIRKNDFLVFEQGPSVDMTLQWATYRDASDQCSLSRIWGGIHPSLDDIPGRLIGIEIGVDGFAEASRYFNGLTTQE